MKSLSNRGEVACEPRAGGTLHDHRYIHPMNIAFLDGRLEREFEAFIPDKDEVTSSTLVSPTTESRFFEPE